MVNRLAAMVEDDDQLMWAVTSVEGAYQDRRFMALVERLGQVEETALTDIMSILREYEVLESIRLAQVAAARIEVVRTFQALLEERVKEKPDLQDFIKEHPWLLDTSWQVLRHESAIDTIVTGELGLEPARDKEGSLRLDFFCIADSLRVVVVEVKRPGHIATVEEWNKFQTYVAALQRHYERLTNPADVRQVQGLFVATGLDGTAAQLAKMAGGRILSFTDWDALLRRAETMQREYLDALTSRVPAGDPRLLNIGRLVRGERAQD
jgi:RecB family endonuclease NucS